MKVVQVTYFECDKCGKQLKLKKNMIEHESTCTESKIDPNQLTIFTEGSTNE